MDRSIDPSLHVNFTLQGNRKKGEGSKERSAFDHPIPSPPPIRTFRTCTWACTGRRGNYRGARDCYRLLRVGEKTLTGNFKDRETGSWLNAPTTFNLFIHSFLSWWREREEEERRRVDPVGGLDQLMGRVDSIFLHILSLDASSFVQICSRLLLYKWILNRSHLFSSPLRAWIVDRGRAVLCKWK